LLFSANYGKTLRLKNFLAELKRRNVIRMAGLYLVGAWLLIQVASTIFPTFGAPNWLLRSAIVLLAIGFIPALIFSWVFELTPEGFKRDKERPPERASAPQARRRMDRMIIVVLVLALTYFAFDKFVLARRRESQLANIPGAPNDPAASANSKSIAVLPFENFSEDKGFLYFADGVQDEILTDLAKIADLKVISRTSVMQFKGNAAANLGEIGQALKVGHVLEGSVQRSVNRVRVTAQLIDVRTETHVWAEKYERDLKDVFAIQSEIAQAIADQLQAKLSPKEKSAISQKPTSDLEAYDRYLQAKELGYESEVSLSRARENLFAAVQLLEEAVTRDPAFLLAHCQLAAGHDLIYFFNYDHTDNRLKLAETSIANAVRLEPDAGQTHLAQAIHAYWGYLDYERAREELTKAQQSLPNDAQVFKFLGLIARRQGRGNEAVQNLERVVELDPRNAEGFGNLAQAYFDLRRYNESMAMFDQIAALEPGNPAARTFRPSIKLYARAEVEPLRAALNAIEADGPAAAADVAPLSFEVAQYERDPAAAARALANIPREGYTDANSLPFPFAWFEGWVARLRGDGPTAQSAFTVARAETEKIVHLQPENAKPLSVLGLIDAHLGQKETAIQEARAAYEMLPVAKDAVDGVLLLSNLAKVCAITGDKNLALEHLETATKLAGGPNYGELQLAREWDSIRDEPRFQKILLSLAPKGPLEQK
jgi:TolB-like protein/Flp pilus assembly protein TadD